MGKFSIDTKGPDLLLIRFPAVATAQEIEEYARALRPHFEKAATASHRLASVADIRPVIAKHATAAMRAVIAEKLADINTDFPGILICDAIVTESVVLRGIATAVYWLRPKDKYPTKFFNDFTEAVIWAERCLSSHRR